MIETPSDGVIIFQGMQDHTAESIKSLEGFHRAWVEEAQTLSSRSLSLLRPTIRENDSELWFTWNPRHKNDAVDALGIAKALLPDTKIVLCTILRAGLPLHQGLLDYFDDAGNAFVAAYRKNHKDGTLEINLEYVTCPDLEGAVLILSDPMLATGGSIQKTIESLEEFGKYSQLHIVSIIASSYGVKQMQRLFPKAHLWIAAEDEELTAKSYIVPGLGDAGDLAFGKKLQE